MTDLIEGMEQWMTRPADERFESIEAMHAVALRDRRESGSEAMPMSMLRVSPANNSHTMQLTANTDRLDFTHWSFGQMCRLARAPAEYLTRLPADVAADALNASLDSMGEKDVQLFARQNGGNVARAITGKKYERIWNADVVERLFDLSDEGWRVPPARPAFEDQPGTRPATEDDVLDGGGFLSISVGDLIAPAGLYMGDRDMFVFMVNENATLDDGAGNPMSRGFFVSNSEVGSKSFQVTRFLYSHVCGNHIVWGAQNIAKLRVVHVGAAATGALENFNVQLTEYADSTAADDTAAIKAFRDTVIAADKDAVIDAIFGKRAIGLGKKTIKAAFDVAEEKSDTYGNPCAVWGMVNGLTEVSQRSAYAGERTKIDTAAGQLMVTEW